MSTPIDFSARGPMYSEMFNLTHPEVGIEMNNPADQGAKLLRWIELLKDPIKAPYASVGFLPPGRVYIGKNFPSFKGVSRAPMLTGAGTGAQNSRVAITAISVDDPGRDPVTGVRGAAIDMDYSDMTLRDFLLVGPSKTAGMGQAPGQGVGIRRGKGGLTYNVKVIGFWAGEEWFNDHQYTHNPDLRGNFCAIHYAENRSAGRGGLGDQHITGQPYLTDCKAASFLVHPYAEMANLEIQGGHSGMSPYWILGYDPAMFGDTITLDKAQVRALADGVSLHHHSREAVGNMYMYDMLGYRGIGDFDFLPTNESGLFHPGWRWTGMPSTAGTEVGVLDGVHYHAQPPLWASGDHRPAFRARAFRNVTVEDPAALVGVLTASAGQFVNGVQVPWQVPEKNVMIELINGGAGSPFAPVITGVVVGGEKGTRMQRLHVLRGRGDVGRYDLIERRPDGDVQRYQGGSARIDGVMLHPSTDKQAWHFLVQGMSNACRVKTWHPSNPDPTQHTAPWPAGTLLKPCPGKPGYATRSEGYGDGQIIGELIEAAPEGESYPTCHIEI